MNVIIVTKQIIGTFYGSYEVEHGARVGTFATGQARV